MGTIRRFEDIECWQAARVLVGLIYSLTRKDGFRHDFELASQIRRSAVSSMANIAEGFHRSSTRDFLKFLDYSRASIAETISHGYVAFDQGYITDQEMSDMKNQAELVWKKVNNFMTYLKSTNQQTSKPTNRLTNQPTNQPTNKQTNQSTNKPNK